MLQQEVIKIWKRAHYFQIKNQKINIQQADEYPKITDCDRQMIARCYQKS